MSYPRVILIGGAPMSGKTAVAQMLAATHGYGCLSTDDRGEAILAVTTKDSHPHLHPMDGYDFREYYVTRSPDELIADASLEHRALWPAVQSRKYAHIATNSMGELLMATPALSEGVMYVRSAQSLFAVGPKQ